MKKALLICLAVAVVAVAVWSGLWFAGQGQIQDRINLEVARAETRGKTITWEALDIGGFPFGYEVTGTNVAFTNAETGLLVRAPKVVSSVDAANVDLVEIRPTGEIRIDLPIPEDTRATDPRLPKSLKLVLVADDLLATLEGFATQGGRMRISAPVANVRMDQDDTPTKLDMTITGLQMASLRSGDKLTTSTQADRVAVNLEGEDTNGQASEIETLIETLTLTTAAEWATGSNVNEVLFGAQQGAVDIVYTAGTIATTATTTDSTGQGGGVFSFAGSAGTGVIGVLPGMLEVRAESRQNRWTVKPKQPDSPVRGTIQAEAVQTFYKMPTGPTQTPQAASLRLAVLDLNADEELWTTLDPDQRLDRSQSELLLDLEATAKIDGRLDQLAPTQAFPVQLSNISVNALDLKALGAELTASGDVEVLQPINLPLGALKIQLTNGEALLLALKQTELIDETMRATAAAMLQVYARKIDGQDRYETNLSFENDGVKMNGLQVR